MASGRNHWRNRHRVRTCVGLTLACLFLQLLRPLAGVRPARRIRRRVHARPDARARARLLHAHDLRVPRAGREHAGLDDLRRRQVRLPRGGDRGRPDARDRLRRGHRAADPLARARGRERRGAATRRVFRRRRRHASQRRPHRDVRAARSGRLLRHRLRRPLAEGTADAGAEARRRRRDPYERRVDAAAPRRAGPQRRHAEGAL